MPNGNVLAIRLAACAGAERSRAGREPESSPTSELWPDTIVEYDPASDQVVWEVARPGTTSCRTEDPACPTTSTTWVTAPTGST